MAYKDNGIGNGSIYIGNVKWNNDYKNVMLFESESARNSWMKSNLKKVDNLDNVIYYNPEGYIDFQHSIEYLETYNYIFYIPDSSIASKPLCLFLNSYEYIAPSTSRCYVTMDVWQMYIYGMTAYQTYIERGVIKKSDDKIGAYLEKEPIGYHAEVSKLIRSSSLHWSPAWNMNTVSVYSGVGSASVKFIYGGHSVGTDATGGYSLPLSQMNDVDAFIKVFNETATFQKSHIDEIIDLTCVPKWMEDVALTQKIIETDEHCEEKLYKQNAIIATSEEVSQYNPNTLVCGYRPRNKKMLTSIAKIFLIHNKNGLNIPLKPEFFDDDVIAGSVKPTVYFTSRPLRLNTIKCAVFNYKNTDGEFNIPYSASLGIGFNSNQGIANFTNKITSIGGVVASAGAVYGGSVTPQTVTGLASSTSNAFNAFDSECKQIGSCSDVTSVSATFVAPEYWEKSPSYVECEAIDNFFDMYGYAINKHQNIKSYMNNRSNWDYVKTINANLRIQAPNDYENMMKDIFNGGVTIWHTYSDFGDYSKENN